VVDPTRTLRTLESASDEQEVYHGLRAEWSSEAKTPVILAGDERILDAYIDPEGKEDPVEL